MFELNIKNVYTNSFVVMLYYIFVSIWYVPDPLLKSTLVRVWHEYNHHPLSRTMMML